MKRIIEYSGIGLVVIVVAVLATLRFVGVEPQDRTPGLWLKGDVPAMPVTDWSFTDEHAEIHLQTSTAYLIPHSVTVYCATMDNKLYLLSAYYDGGTFPEMRSWNRNIVRDPRIRLKIGDQLFDQTVSYVDDESIRRPVYDALGEKYPNWADPHSKTCTFSR